LRNGNKFYKIGKKVSREVNFADNSKNCENVFPQVGLFFTNWT